VKPNQLRTVWGCRF